MSTCVVPQDTGTSNKITTRVDSGGDGLMAAMSVPVAQECSGGNLADMVSSLQQQVFEIQSVLATSTLLEKVGARVKRAAEKEAMVLVAAVARV